MYVVGNEKSGIHNLAPEKKEHKYAGYHAKTLPPPFAIRKAAQSSSTTTSDNLLRRDSRAVEGHDSILLTLCIIPLITRPPRVLKTAHLIPVLMDLPRL